MQDLIGLEEFTGKPAFDSSLFVYVRKHMNVESINEMSLAMMKAECRKSGESKESGRNKSDIADKKDDGINGGDDSFVDEGDPDEKRKTTE